MLYDLNWLNDDSKSTIIHLLYVEEVANCSRFFLGSTKDKTSVEVAPSRRNGAMNAGLAGLVMIISD